MKSCLLIAYVLAQLLGAVPALARTWTVMQDGSGDYEDIQVAVDRCAVGDTVLVGPGRYDNYQPFVPGEVDIGWEAVVGVAVDSLTIRGVDNETVIIGSESEWDQRLLRIGLTMKVTLSWINVENIRFENTRDTKRGIDLFTGNVSDCVFYNGTGGIFVERGLGVLVEQCRFEDSSVTVVGIGDLSDANVVIRNCRFDSGGAPMGGGVNVSRHPNTLVESCYYEDVGVAVSVLDNSVVSIRGCEMIRGNFAVNCTNYGAGSVDIRNCTAEGQYYNSIWIYGTHLTGSGNTLICAGDYTIKAPNSSAEFHGNHIMKASVGTVDVQFYTVSDQGLDFTGNWWGTTDQDSISAWINDVDDDPELVADVEFQPYLAAPVPAEKASMGDLKRMFR